MQIRTQTGAVMYEADFRTYIKDNGGPSWETTTTEVLESLGADVVLRVHKHPGVLFTNTLKPPGLSKLMVSGTQNIS